MEYIEIDIRLKLANPYAEIFIARLNEIKYESFSTDEFGLKAYIRSDLFNKKKLTEIVDDISSFTKIDLSINAIKKENWNADWENNYSPVHINKDCVIRAHFHDRFPNIEHEIIITPKMSFGTGHHETTFLVMNQIFELNLEGKQVLDIGSGTGVLSILASKLGAKKIVGIDIDKWAYENAIENSKLNNISNIQFIEGTAESIGKKMYDVVLANINRNIILADIQKYTRAMRPKSDMILSGFLKQDVKIILNKIKQLKFNLVASKNKNKWQMLHLRRV
jgi:ribosomal protein L11 methyltransferase